MPSRHVLAGASLLAVIAGCGQLQTPRENWRHQVDTSQEPPAAQIHLTALAENEVAIVINANATLGSHAGLFVGKRLLDPSGTYSFDRSEDPDWPGPSLADYVRFHMRDGKLVRVYRFRLAEADIHTITIRMDHAGWTLPLFCAATVKRTVKGVGPFAAIGNSGWDSPLALAKELDRIVGSGTASGTCQMPGGERCRP
ncbi:MAG: hypothetical protein ACLPXB_15345 [Thiobacillaceae bacterium]